MPAAGGGDAQGTAANTRPAAGRGEVQSTVTAYCRLEGGANLRPGMTGHARVYGGKRPVGAVLLDRGLRYLRTEFWW
jgi:hypothetical protein